MTYEQRDIVLVPFPYSDLTGAKLRPALIISNEKLNRSDDRICVLVTSRKSKESIELTHLEQGTIPFKSYVKPYRIFTIDIGIIRKKLCRVSQPFHQKVLDKLNTYVSPQHF